MAKNEVKIKVTDYGVEISQLNELEAALKDPSYIMRSIGAYLLSQAHHAFYEQKFDGKDWLPNYPGQSSPFINIAGSLQSLNKGIAPGKGGGGRKLFENKPVMMKTGDLVRSVAPEAPGANKLLGTHVVQVGSVLPYAGLMQWGGESSQPVTSTAKKALSAWMKSLRSARRKTATYNPKTKEWGPHEETKPKKRKKSSKRGTPKQSRRGTPKRKRTKSPKTSGLSGAQNAKFQQQSMEIERANKLGFLFQRNTLATKVTPRPFLGITKRNEEEIQKILQDWVVKNVVR